MIARWIPVSIQDWFFHKRLPILRFALYVLVLLASAVLAPRVAGGDRMVRLLFMGLLAIAPGVILLRWPSLGLLGLVLGGMLVPFSIGTGSETGINVSVLMTAGLLVLWVLEITTGKNRLQFSRPVFPLIFFMISALLGFAFGQLRYFQVPPASLMAQLGGLMIFLLLGGVFLLSAHQIADLRWLEWIVWTFLILAGIYILGSLIPVRQISWTVQGWFQRAVQDSSFWAWVVALAFSQALVNRRLKGWVRGALFAMALSTLYVTVIVKQSWVSGWLPALTAIAVITWFGQPRLRKLIIFAGLIVLALRFDSLYNYIFAEGDNEYSLITRLEAWSIMLKVIQANPVFGVGPSNYYWYTVVFPISGYFVYFNSHNNYFDMIAQIGLVGLFCFFWFAFETGRLGLSLVEKAPDGFPRAYVIGALGGLAAMLVSGMLGDWIIPFVYNVGMEGFRASAIAWMFLGGLVVVERFYAKSGGTESNKLEESSNT